MDDSKYMHNEDVIGHPCNRTTDELSECEKEKSRTGSSAESRELLCVPTHMPQFLLAYTPSVSV